MNASTTPLNAQPGDSRHGLMFTLWSITAAFGTYFCMYAFRKPFTAATYDGEELWGMDLKLVLIAAQTIGYALSKVIGIKVVSEMAPHWRAAAILLVILMAELVLVLFALLPGPWNVLCLFANGLALGMVFGLVLSFLEGRHLTELLAAGLCASFIVASGVVKSVGAWLLTWEISAHWMPSVCGLLFFPPLMIFVGMLSRIPPPTASDVANRSERPQMTAADRRGFLWRHGSGLFCLMSVYVLLTVIRGLRDDFSAELWTGWGLAGTPAVFAQSEMLVGLGILAINGSAVLIRSHRFALLTSLLMSALGLLIALVAIHCQRQGWVSPFLGMVWIGLGVSIPYVAFHTAVFERLLALLRERSNVGFLMYLADSLGYAFYVPVLFGLKSVGTNEDFTEWFLTGAFAMCVCGIIFLGGSLWFFRRIFWTLPASGLESSAAPAFPEGDTVALQPLPSQDPA